MISHELKSRLHAVNIFQVEQYLIAKGWIKAGSFNNMASIWHRKEEQFFDYELLLPYKDKARDFEDRLLDVFLNLSRFEGCDLIELIENVANFSADLIRVRIVHEDVKEGSIPLEDGVLLHEKARDLMTSAALSTMSKRRHFIGSRPPETNQYLNQLRLGQSQVGSYIINIISPIVEEKKPQISTETNSFSRLVTMNLVSGLHALNDSLLAYEDHNDMSIFESIVDRGVSANMCEALIGLTGSQRRRSFTIAVAPSIVQPLVIDDMPLQFKFNSSYSSSLEKVAEYFKENYVLDNISISGYVKRLDRIPGAKSGTVTITALIKETGTEKNVQFELGEMDYIEAIHAHEQKQAVGCQGDLHVTPRSAHLLNPHDFRVYRNSNLF